MHVDSLCTTIFCKRFSVSDLKLILIQRQDLSTGSGYVKE